MKKATSYFEDEIYSKMEEMAKEDKRSFNQILNMIVEKGLKANEPASLRNPTDVTLSQSSFDEVKETAISDNRTVDYIADTLIQQALKEKKRLREKYLKSLEKKQ